MKISNCETDNQGILTSQYNSISIRERNFGLSKIEFDKLASSLRVGKEELFETIFLSHFEDCKRYIMKRHGISVQVAYDITMDTLIDFRKLLIQEKVFYGNLRYLFTKIATQNWIRYSKKENRIDLSLFYNVNENENREHVFIALNNAWNSLDKENREILEAYFYNRTSLVMLAKTMGVTDVCIRKKKQRGLEKLRAILFDELQIKKNGHVK